MLPNLKLMNDQYFRRTRVGSGHQTTVNRNKKKKTVIFAVLILLCVIGWFWYQQQRYQHLLQTPVDATDQKKYSLVIKQGDSVNQIAKNLTDKNLILDQESFTRYLKEQNLDRKLVVGRFLISKSQTIPQIAQTLSNVESSQAIITIPEGATIRDIDQKLAAQNIIESGEFITATKNFSAWNKYPYLDKEKIEKLPFPLEGYLFPDTYFLQPVNFSCDDLISMMLHNFEKKMADAGVDLSEFKNGQPATPDLLKGRSLFEVITMASIVEKEVRTSKDIPIVAGILWKRLDENWQIGADATLLYLNSEDREISYQDLKEDNPYNTRKHTGLPPGPINNPGIKAILATLNPEKSSYYYYLTKPDTGEVVYAVTNDEHNLNKSKYLN